MKRKFMQGILVVVVAGLIMVLAGIVGALPWWSFLVPVMLLGYLLTLLKLELNAFALGFMAGFLIWFGGNLLFNLTYNGLILSKLSNLLSVPTLLLLLVAGIIGGVLSGLAMYVGQHIFRDKGLPNLES
jgi:hypothetical protein